MPVDVNSLIEESPSNNHVDVTSLIEGSQKKNSVGSGLLVGQNGQLQKSSPSQSQSGLQGNNYNIANTVPEYNAQPQQKKSVDFSALSDIRHLQQSNTALNNDNTYIARKNTDLVEKEIQAGGKDKYFQEQKETKIKNTNEAIENTAANFVKGKAKVGSPQYNFIKKKLTEDVQNGDAFVAQDPKTGKYGLQQGIGFWESAVNGWNKAINNNEDLAKFNSRMTDQQALDFINKQQDEQQKNNSAYIGTRPTNLGSVGQLLGENLPFFGKAIAGGVVGTGLAAIAPETGGLSLEGLPAVFAFAATAPDMMNQYAFKETMRRYQILRNENPKMPPLDAIHEARKGATLGYLQGGLLNAGLMKYGGEEASQIPNESKNVIANSVKSIVKSGAKTGLLAADAQAATDIAGKIGGVHTDHDQMVDDVINEGANFFTVGSILHSLALGANGALHLPGAVKSAFKYGLKDVPQEKINDILDENVKLGNLTQEVADKTKEDIAGYKQASEKVIPNLAPDVESSVTGLIQKKDNIQKAQDNITQQQTDLSSQQQTKDESFAPVYESKISDLEKDKGNLENQKNETSDQIKGIVETGDVNKFEKSPITGKSLEDEAENKSQISIPTEEAGIPNESANKIEQPTEEKISELLKPHENSLALSGYKTNDEKLKFIAQQAQNISNDDTKQNVGDERSSVENAFGKELVDAAIAKFPEKDLLKNKNENIREVGKDKDGNFHVRKVGSDVGIIFPTKEKADAFIQKKGYVAKDIGNIDYTEKGSLKQSNEGEDGVNSVSDALNKYNNSENYTFNDMVNDIEGIAKDHPESEKLNNAIKKYREEQQYDYSVSGRGDMAAAEDEFEKTMTGVAKNESITPEKSLSSQYEKELEQQLPNTLSPTEKQGSIAGGEANAAATSIVGAIQKANDAAKERGEGLSQERIKNQEEKQLKSHAEENGLMLPDTFGEPHANGMEQDVYLNPDGKAVTKVHGNITHDTWHDLFNRIAVHNSLFPDVAYKLKGFTNHEGYFSAVFEQPLITKGGEPVKFSEVKGELAKLGFEPTSENKGVGDNLPDVKKSDADADNTFINDKTGIKITDLHGENVMRGTDGKLHFIDPIIEFTKDRIEHPEKYEKVEIPPTTTEVKEPLKDVESTTKASEKKKARINTDTNEGFTSKGVQLKFKISKHSDELGKFITVRAKSFDGKQLGYAKFIDRGDNKLEGSEVEVPEKYQKQGIASAIYSFADAKGYEIKPSSLQTPEGKALWESLNRGGDSVPVNENKPKTSSTEKSIAAPPEVNKPISENEGSNVPNENHREDIMNMLESMKSSGFDYRITSDISQKDREKGVQDLRNGKNSAAARKVKSLIDDIISKGELPIHRGLGGQTEKFDISFEHWFGLEPKEREQAENLDDETTNIINDEGITKNNIDNLKHLFNGFPYTEEDFNKIKAHLEGQDEGNVDIKGNGSESTKEKIKPVIISPETIKKEQQIPITEIGKKEEGQPTKEENVKPNEPKEVEKENKGEESKKESKFSGIAERVKKERGISTESGEGWSQKQANDFGKAMIKSGVDPEDVLSDFEKDGLISGERMAIVNEHANELARQTEKAGDAGDEAAYKKAFEKENDWAKRVQPMQTEWQKSGVAQGGQTEINTGSFTSLKRAFVKENKGNEPNAAHIKRLNEISDKYNKLKENFEKLQKKLSDVLSSKSGKKEISNADRAAKRKERIEKVNKKIDDTVSKWAKKLSADLPKGTQKQGLGIDEILGAVGKTMKAAYKAGEDVAKIIDDAIRFISEKLGRDDWDKEGFKKDWEDSFKEDVEKKKKINPLALLDKFNDKHETDMKFSPQDAKDIWDYIQQEYLDNNTDLDKAVMGAAGDLGLNVEQIQHAIASNKGSKEITDEMYMNQHRSRVLKRNAEIYIKAQGDTKGIKIIKALTELPRRMKIFAHGTVPMETHVGMSKFDVNPATAKIYWQHVIKSYKLYGSTPYYEKSLQILKAEPTFPLFKRAGLANDPNVTYDYTYQGGKNIVGKLEDASRRGFDVLKFYRQAKMQYYYDKLSKVEKGDMDILKMYASIVNHETGTVGQIFKEDSKAGQLAEASFFALKLEGSRWASLTDNAKAIATIMRLRNSTKAEKVQSKLIIQRAARIVGAYMGSLLINNEINKLTGNPNRINITNPLKSDFLDFKMGDKRIGLSSGMASLFRFLGKIFHGAAGDTGKNSRKDVLENAGTNYVRGKLSPGFSEGVDIAEHHDFQGNTLPFYNDKPLHRWNHKLTYAEYASSFSPIPFEGAVNNIKNEMEDNGVDKPTANIVVGGIAAGVIEGATGIRINQTFKNSTLDDIPIPPQYKQLNDYITKERGFNLPNTSHSSEKITDPEKNQTGALSDFPQNVQDNYDKIHQEKFFEFLNGIAPNAVAFKNTPVYVTTETDPKGVKTNIVSVDEPKKEGDNTKMVKIGDLDKEEFAQLMSIAQKSATKETKTDERLFQKNVEKK